MTEKSEKKTPEVGTVVRDEAGRYGLVVGGAKGAALAVVWLPEAAAYELPLTAAE